MQGGRHLRLLVAVALFAVALAAALAIRAGNRTDTPARYEKTVTAMGTLVTVSASAPDKASGEFAIDAALATVRRLEGLLSRFAPDSDVSRINRSAPGDPAKVEPETFECIERSLELSRRTGGAFDVTVGPLVALWKAAGENGRLPSADGIGAARRNVSYEFLKIDRQSSTVTVELAGMAVDLSSKAKGYVVHKAAEAMRAAGITSGFVNGGGDIAFIGANPDGRPWRVGVADPRDKDKLTGALYVRDCGVVTSGNYQQFSLIEGKRYSHIIDPHTGWALEGDKLPASVTVIGPDAAQAAGWSTALSVLGRDGSGAAGEAGIEFLMYFIEGDKLDSFESPGMAKYREAK